jgi:hypothetical protein
MSGSKGKMSGTYGWRAIESARARRAAAESAMRSAPRTPAAPGSLEAPMTLSRWRSVNGGLGAGWGAHDARIQMLDIAISTRRIDSPW